MYQCNFHLILNNFQIDKLTVFKNKERINKACSSALHKLTVNNINKLKYIF